jgi:hypothetical protein
MLVSCLVQVSVVGVFLYIPFIFYVEKPSASRDGFISVFMICVPVIFFLSYYNDMMIF